MPPEGKPHTPTASRLQSSGNPLQLRLAHFFLWTAATAVALLLLRPTLFAFSGGEGTSNADEVSNLSDVIRVGISVAVAPIYGAALMAFATGVTRRVRGDVWLDVAQPGHWFLLIVGAVVLGAGLLGHVLIGPLDPNSPPGNLWLILGSSLAGALLLILVAPTLVLFAVLEVEEPRHWKIAFRVFGAAVAASLFGCPCMLGAYMQPHMLLLPAALLALFHVVVFAAMGIDIANRAPRDVAHWLGVLSVFALTIHVLALAVLGI